MKFIKHMRILSLFFLIHFSLLCKEISISGKIQDFNSLEPISDANIFLKNKAIGTTSDDEGYFLLLLKDI